MYLSIGKQVILKATLNGLEIFQAILSIKKGLPRGFMLLLRRFLNTKLELPCKGLFKF